MSRLLCSVLSCALRQRRAPRFRACSLPKGHGSEDQRRTLSRCVNKVLHNIRMHLTGSAGFACFLRQVMRGVMPFIPASLGFIVVPMARAGTHRAVGSTAYARNHRRTGTV